MRATNGFWERIFVAGNFDWRWSLYKLETLCFWGEKQEIFAVKSFDSTADMAQTRGFSRALKMPHRGIFARRDAKRRTRAVRIPPCSPCIVCRKNKKQRPARCCFWRRRWDSNPRGIAAKSISSLLCNCDGDVRFGVVSVSPVPAEIRLKSGFFARKALRDGLF